MALLVLDRLREPVQCQDSLIKFIDGQVDRLYRRPMAARVADTRLSIPELMRLARGSYKRAADVELARRDMTDLPRNAGFVLAYLANGDDSVEQMVRRLGVSKQAFSQLVDVLVSRGYLTREVHAEDRRRMSLGLTDRGSLAAEAIRVGVQTIDDELEQRLTKAQLAGLRRGLAVLAELKESFNPAATAG